MLQQKGRKLTAFYEKKLSEAGPEVETVDLNILEGRSLGGGD
jgi:hypothetical protein